MTNRVETELRGRIEQLETLVAALIGEAVKHARDDNRTKTQWGLEGLIERDRPLAEAWKRRAADIGLKPFP